MKKLLTAIIVALASSAASANFVYNVNRIIGAGSVFGTITTDETLGAITSLNIVDWTFTLTSASLTGGSHIISSASGGTIDPGSGTLSATADGLSFDFGGASFAYFLFWDAPSDPTHFYCLQTNGDPGCFDTAGAGEAIGEVLNGAISYEAARLSGVVPITTPDKNGTVPEPTGLALVALGLVGVGLSRRKQR